MIRTNQQCHLDAPVWINAQQAISLLHNSSCLLGAVFGALVALTPFLLCLLLAWTADAEAAALSLACTNSRQPRVPEFF